MKTIGEIMAQIGAILLSVTDTDGAQLFGRVENYDATDLQRALSELVLHDASLALVIFNGARWEREAAGPLKLTLRRTIEMTVLVSDRAFSEPRQAVFGGDECTGVLPLAETILPLLTTRLFADAEAVELLPTGVDLLEVAEENNPQPGRKLAAITLQARGGVLQAATSRHPIR